MIGTTDVAIVLSIFDKIVAVHGERTGGKAEREEKRRAGSIERRLDLNNDS
jgi:hypothetical protein